MARHTLQDVATHARVSKATASRVLNGNARVDPATRRRVLAAMAELEYTPSDAARRLSLGRTLTISVVTSFLTRPQAAERLRGVDAVLSDSEFDLVIYNVETVEKRDQYLQHLALAQRTDGLLVISLPPRPEDVVRLSSAAIPVVVIDAHGPAVEGLPHVVGDDIAGGELATRHLLELGHRAVAFLGDQFENPFGFTSSRHRFMGYERALAAAGIAARAGPRRARRPQPLRGARAGRTDARRRRASDRRSSPPATPRPWASSPRHTTRASTSPMTCRSSATTTSRWPTTSG